MAALFEFSDDGLALGLGDFVEPGEAAQLLVMGGDFIDACLARGVVAIDAGDKAVSLAGAGVELLAAALGGAAEACDEERVDHGVNPELRMSNCEWIS